MHGTLRSFCAARVNSAVGADHTPLSIGPDEKAYTQNNGQLFVVGN